MDINLPGISGIEALKILREDPATAHIPVVALSANAVPRDIAKGLEAGFFRYLTKPLRVDEFMETLDVALAFAEQEPDQEGTVVLDPSDVLAGQGAHRRRSASQRAPAGAHAARCRVWVGRLDAPIRARSWSST